MTGAKSAEDASGSEIEQVAIPGIERNHVVIGHDILEEKAPLRRARGGDPRGSHRRDLFCVLCPSAVPTPSVVSRQKPEKLEAAVKG